MVLGWVSYNGQEPKNGRIWGTPTGALSSKKKFGLLWVSKPAYGRELYTVISEQALAQVLP